MILYLTKQRNGSFLLSKYPPIIAEVGETGEYDAYLQAGDPIGPRHLCDALFKHIGSDNMKILETKKINVRIEEIK